MCFSCICLIFFVLHVLVFIPFLFLLVSGLAAACDCGTAWTFLLTFYYYSYARFPHTFYEQFRRRCENVENQRWLPAAYLSTDWNHFRADTTRPPVSHIGQVLK